MFIRWTIREGKVLAWLQLTPKVHVKPMDVSNQFLLPPPFVKAKLSRFQNGASSRSSIPQSHIQDQMLTKYRYAPAVQWLGRYVVHAPTVKETDYHSMVIEVFSHTPESDTFLQLVRLDRKLSK